VERRVGGPTILIEGLHLYVSKVVGNTAGNSDKTGRDRSLAHVTSRCRICATGYVLVRERDFVRPLSHLDAVTFDAPLWRTTVADESTTAQLF